MELVWKRCLAAEMPATYAATIHDLDPVRQAELYTVDGVLDQVWGVSSGRDQIAAAYGERFSEWEDSNHWVTNIRVTTCSDEAAVVKSFVLGLFTFTAEHHRDPLLYRGEYVFELTWSTERWEISRLTITRHGVAGLPLIATSF
ncbi:hypothetical protein GCM10009836_34900 [Pseudonocardia ailaonensis]|uniref:SnoaL-like domain-containing protein n=1 Tax=Pseudonocardia ailaonensis TaxID=367279 RepID=A0ABN2N4U0_9PSEU